MGVILTLVCASAAGSASEPGSESESESELESESESELELELASVAAVLALASVAVVDACWHDSYAELTASELNDASDVSNDVLLKSMGHRRLILAQHKEKVAVESTLPMCEYPQNF